MAAHQSPPSLGFSRPEQWSGLPFPSPMHESEKWKWSRSVASDSQRPHGLQPTRLLGPWDFPGKSTGMGCHCLSRVLLWDPIDGNTVRSSVPGIFQARILEWVAIFLSSAWKWKVKVKSLSRARLLATPWTAAYQDPPSMGFSRQEYWSGLPWLLLKGWILLSGDCSLAPVQIWWLPYWIKFEIC